MEKYQFLPKGGIEDDISADMNSHRTFKFSLSESNLEDCAAPEECTKLIRQCLQDNPSNKTSNTNKRLASKEIAFPLEDSELFWNRMFEGKNSDVTAETNTHDPKSYITFNVKEGSEDKNENEKLILSKDQRKALLEAAPGDEKLEIKPKLGKKALAKQKKVEREKTKGSDWYDMKAPEITDEVKRDLEVLQMRSALDPKRFYKKNDRSVLPKYFQIGQYIDGPLDQRSTNGLKKSKNKSLVDELMADAEFKKYNKRKYTEIIEEKAKQNPKRYRGNPKKKKHSSK